MRRRNVRRTSSEFPPQLIRSGPRNVGLSAGGLATLIAVTAAVVGASFGAISLYRDAAVSERHVTLFTSEAVAVDADVIRVQQRGDGDDRRHVIDYRYLAGTRELTGTATLRGEARDRHPLGSRVQIRYLASEPDSSWIEGAGPRRQPLWPVALLFVGSLIPVLLVSRVTIRQADLLANGRLAHATVTNVVKKQGQHGTAWRVTYQWQLLSGAVRSAGYDDASKQPPAVGALLPVLYDRDEPSRQGRYPFSLVKLKAEG